MPNAAPAHRARLAKAMEDRLAELGLRWQDVSAASGVAVRTLQLVRDPDREAVPSKQTLEGIDKGLQWQPGSARQLYLSGRDPVPLAAATPGPARQATAVPDGTGKPRGEAEPGDDPDLAPFITGVREDLGRAMAAYGPGFTGAQAFSSPYEAETWDDPDRLMPDDGDRVRLIARNRRRAEQWQSEERRIVLPVRPAPRDEMPG